MKKYLHECPSCPGHDTAWYDVVAELIIFSVKCGLFFLVGWIVIMQCAKIMNMRLSVMSDSCRQEFYKVMTVEDEKRN